ncbi:MAG: polysaccharide biosynthesis protein [Anaerolineaceae bacterium]|nr:polysaccharide biosynthesis protein [Anaerolineaceae bacterium]
MYLHDKRVLITGGTGSLGKVLLNRILSGEMGTPQKITIFSRDEAKQHDLRLQYLQQTASTDEVIYENFRRLISFQIGDVRDFSSISTAVSRADVVFNAAALKQVPTCEYYPYEAVRTNIAGPENIVRAIREHKLPVDTVIGISTDKACKPVNVMGMTKAIQERIFIQANVDSPATRFVCVRYGNVLASRGSVIPLFHKQIRSGGPVTITDERMTRFLLSLDQAVDTVFAALAEAKPGETYIPRIPAARVVDIAAVLIGDRPIDIQYTGIRPGEKMHEILVSEEEMHRVVDRGAYYAIQAILPEVATEPGSRVALNSEYSSADEVMSREALKDLLKSHRLLIDDVDAQEGEMLR